MDNATRHAALAAQMLMGHCVPSAHLAMDRTTVVNYSWDVDQVRQQLHVPLNAVWNERVLALEVHGLASFAFYTAPVFRDEDGTEHEIPGWQDQPREDWGSISIFPRGVLRLAALYGRLYVPCEASPAVLAHWELVQTEAKARLHAVQTERHDAYEARWQREWPEQAAAWKAFEAAYWRRWEEDRPAE